MWSSVWLFVANWSIEKTRLIFIRSKTAMKTEKAMTLILILNFKTLKSQFSKSGIHFNLSFVYSQLATCQNTISATVRNNKWRQCSVISGQHRLDSWKPCNIVYMFLSTGISCFCKSSWLQDWFCVSELPSVRCCPFMQRQFLALHFHEKATARVELAQLLHGNIFFLRENGE